ncbi:MAG: right-handed parallel beta-helix repeat-containing protein [Phycisphaerales bacterium]|nr:right-handed parallel beta-helix repeat-containing protein [Phycisphaerales bacterium]
MQQRVRIAAIAAGVTLGAFGAGYLTAGPLDPPGGSVASTYKTLSEIEPRIAISQATTPGDADSVFRITQPGSYYLTGNLTGVSGKRGIEIAASNVTIDLRGFALQGVAGSLQGIASGASGLNTITIRNGTISAWGASGIDLLGVGTFAEHSMICDVVSRDNGETGIRTALYSVVRGCLAADNINYGILLTNGGAIENSVAEGNDQHGIVVGNGASVTNCSAQYNRGDGINIGRGSSATGCGAQNNTGAGFAADSAATFSACSSFSNTGAGFRIVSSTVTDCSARENRGGGIIAGDDSLIAACTSVANTGPGISAASRSAVRGSTSSANTTDGIVVGDGTTVETCTVDDNTGRGIAANNGCRITANMTRNNQLDGIAVNFSCTVEGNNCNGDGAAAGTHGAVRVTGQANRIDSNNITFADRGLLITSGGNTIIRNSVKGCAVNFDIVVGNDAGPIGSAATAASPWANIQY